MITYLLAFILAMSGLSIVLLGDSMIKKVMGLNIFTNGIHVLLVSLGYMYGHVSPIASKHTTLANFISQAVDPLPQALIITSIVIDLSIISVALAMIIKMEEERI